MQGAPFRGSLNIRAVERGGQPGLEQSAGLTANHRYAFTESDNFHRGYRRPPATDQRNANRLFFTLPPGTRNLRGRGEGTTKGVRTRHYRRPTPPRRPRRRDLVFASLTLRNFLRTIISGRSQPSRCRRWFTVAVKNFLIPRRPLPSTARARWGLGRIHATLFPP